MRRWAELYGAWVAGVVSAAILAAYWYQRVNPIPVDDAGSEPGDR